MNSGRTHRPPLVPRQRRRRRRFADARLRHSLRRSGPPPHPPAREITAWIVIEPDDTVIIRVAKSEMGQGGFTAFPMLVAEELECDWDKVSGICPAAREPQPQPCRGRHVHRREPLGSVFAGIPAPGRRDRARNAHPAAAARWSVPAGECPPPTASSPTCRPAARDFRPGCRGGGRVAPRKTLR